MDSTLTLTINYCRRDVPGFLDHVIYSERKTFATTTQAFGYEWVLRKRHHYAIRSAFNPLVLFVNVEPREG